MKEIISSNTAVDIKTIILVFAFVLSILSFLFTRRSWVESNRPIITAEIITHAAGNEGIAYDILVHNTGNRPAANIQLKAEEKYINKLLASGCSESIKNDINNIFSPRVEISILHDGESVSNAFGHTSSTDSSSLNYGVKFPITITYRGLGRKKFKTKQKLIVKDSEYFAGSGWSKRNS